MKNTPVPPVKKKSTAPDEEYEAAVRYMDKKWKELCPGVRRGMKKLMDKGTHGNNLPCEFSKVS